MWGYRGGKGKEEMNGGCEGKWRNGKREVGETVGEKETRGRGVYVLPNSYVQSVSCWHWASPWYPISLSYDHHYNGWTKGISIVRAMEWKIRICYIVTTKEVVLSSVGQSGQTVNQIVVWLISYTIPPSGDQPSIRQLTCTSYMTGMSFERFHTHIRM